MLKIGHGYDVHCLREGRRLVLGGVEIPFEKGLDGHSDADVLIHAVADSIYGALGMGDIGIHFPCDDDRFLNMDSRDILRAAAKSMENAGYTVGNVDATVIAQAPKLSPYIPKMREQIALCLGLDERSVNIKATTEEHMGFTGEGRGISAHAVCIIVKRQ